MVEQVICQNCILTDGFLGLKVNSEGLCNFCQDSSHENANWAKVQVSEARRSESLEDWNKTVKRMQENKDENEYDCVIGYSGGKDSTALLDTFVNEYDLKPFLVTIDTGFMTDVAKKNVKDTLAKMNLQDDHLLIEDAIPTFTKLYKHFFFDHGSNEKTLTVDICHVCTDLIHTIVVKEAMKKGISQVIIGFSPDQIARYFYEPSEEETIKDGLPAEKLKEKFNESDLQWYLTEADISSGTIPRVIYPYHVIPYDENEIISRIEKKNLVEIGKSDPTLTNCHVVKAALMYDLYRYGGITYTLQYAELIRQKEWGGERRKSRKGWLRLVQNIGRNILNGTFNSDGMSKFFARIGTSREEILQNIEKRRLNDPNEAQVLKNIELIRNKKLK